MALPLVAIVGRPNVGKSSFFNKVVGARLAIVEDVPGVTRDRIYAEAEWNGKAFALIDTGGIDERSDDVMFAQMREQAQIAIDMADLIVFMVDGKEGVTSTDRDVADLLRSATKPVLLIANKIDNPRKLPDDYYDLYELGFGEPIPVSAANMTGLGDALDGIVTGLLDSRVKPENDDGGDNADSDSLKLAIIGKPNVGKSSFVNAIVGEYRVIVSDVPGTTRDSIDTPFEYDGERFTLIDTAGIRRRSKVEEGIERYSVVRAIGAIERSDVCLLMIDATEGVTEQDKKIAGLAHESGKGVVIAVNKWDLVEKDTNTMARYEKKVYAEMPFLSWAPQVYISVKDGQRLKKVLDTVSAVAANCALRVPTSPLNALIQDAVAMKQPPSDKGKRLKIYYVTQVGIQPPLFSFKVNRRDLMHFSYARYLENRIRAQWGFTGTPVRFVFREKGEEE
ncbi:MAG: ribosome biogenesis GTPase Der [Clostridiales Family XIII bacterium]|jgi:GTP-binding protein|nr:ribosome biogenesis GTPase Der [Clostridiales Family XIII bacterium]